MELRQLRYFLAVCDARHFTRAAEACFVSQPALSQQIALLERELGGPLFDRLSTGVELTSAGRVLREHAQRVLRELENARAAVEDVVGRVRGELSVATVQTASLGALVDVLARFRAAHPEVQVRVQELRSDEVVHAVVAGRANVGLAYLPVREGSVRTKALWQEELVLLIPADHEHAGGVVRVKDLSTLPLIVPPGGFCLRDGIDAVLARASRGADIVAEISGMESIGEAVRLGLGVTIVPAAWIGRAALADLAHACIEPTPRRTIGVLRHRDRHACLATRAFLEALRPRRAAPKNAATGRRPVRAASA